MEQKEYKELRRLIIKGMAGRKQQEVAEACGLSVSHFNRMLNKTYIPKPSKMTVVKLSKGLSGVTVAELYEACGYTDEAAVLAKPDADLTPHQKRMKMPVYKRARCLADDLRAFLSEKEPHTVSGSILNGGYLQREKVIPHLSAYMDEFRTLYCGEDVSFTWLEEKEYAGDGHDMAGYEMGCKVELNFSSYSAWVYLVFYYDVTARGVLRLSDVAMDGASVAEAGIMDDGIAKEFSDYGLDVKSLPDVAVVHKKTQEELQQDVGRQLLQTIFPDEVGFERVPTVVHGFGFYLDKIPASVYRAFLLFHKDTFLSIHVAYGDCKPEDELMAFLEQEPDSYDWAELIKLFEEYRCVSTYETGLGAAVANIISEETGMEFDYYQADEPDFADNRDCLICGDAKLDPDTVAKALMPYARELGVDYLETCYYDMYLYKYDVRVKVE